jgi:hypothetical protein
MSWETAAFLAIAAFALALVWLVGLEYLRLIHRELRAIKGAVEDTKRYTRGD